jgi:ribosome-binding protein aMBF1 (putative translation factor)
MKKQTTTGSAKRSKAAGLAEIKLSVLVPTAKIENAAKMLEGVASLMPSLDSKQLKGAGRKLPEHWALKFKNKGHEIRVVTTEGEKVLNVENSIDTSFVASSPLSEGENSVQSSRASKEKRFNKFGEEVVSLKDIFPDKHPGMVLKGFRQRDNMTQQQLADVLNIKQSRVCDLESGSRAISKLMAERLGKVFKISYKAFL